MKSKRRFVTWIILAAGLMLACACPATLPGLNPLKGIESTAGALVSEVPQGAVETMEAVITQDAAGWVATAGAMATQSGFSMENIAKTAEGYLPEEGTQPPQDIPILSGEVSGLRASENLVTYQVKKPFDEVKKFYEEQMPAQGWERKDKEGFDMPGVTLMVFVKAGRTANVSMVGMGEQTQVLIEISQG